MIELEKLTAEKAFEIVIKTNPSSLSSVISAKDGDYVTLTTQQSFRIPAKYAKFLLKEYLNDRL